MVAHVLVDGMVLIGMLKIYAGMTDDQRGMAEGA